MNIPVLMVEGFEADDVIGTLAKAAVGEGVETYMLTSDKDYGQLIGDTVKMYRPRHGGGYEVIGTEQINEKYGISRPSQVIDLLALMGDAADNFPGCPGVGEKTAVKLINEFDTVDNLLEHTDQLKGALKKKVEEHVDDIRLSKTLAIIKTDVPVTLDLEKLKVTDPDEPRLRKIFDELEFKSLIDKFLNKPKKSPQNVNLQLDLFGEFQPADGEVEKNSSFESLKTIDHDYQLVEKQEDIKKLFDFLLTFDFLSLDTETTSTNPIEAELVGLSFSVHENQAFYVPVPASQSEAQQVVEIFRPLYENPRILKIGQNRILFNFKNLFVE